MTDEHALLAAVWDGPHADTPRLVYADWLDDHGGPAGRARAEFIRVQCREAALDDNDPAAAGLRTAAATLQRRHGRAWRAGLPAPLRRAPFERGFVAPPLVELTLGAFRRRTAASLTPAPLWAFQVRVPTAADYARLDCPALARTGTLVLLGFDPRVGGASTWGEFAASARVRNLATLRTWNCFLTDEDAVATGRSQSLTALRELHLPSAGLTAAGVRALARAPFAPGLRSLDLSYSFVDDAMLGEIAAGRLTGLRVLRLACPGARHYQTEAGSGVRGCTARGLRRLLRSVAMEQLRELDLTGLGGITDAAAREIATAPGLGRLRRLVVAGTDVTGAGVRVLADRFGDRVEL